MSATTYLVKHLRWIPLAYAGFLCLLAVPAIQRSLIYLHPVKIGYSALTTPETVGFAPGKVRNFKIKTKDGQTLGAWHVLPDQVYDMAIKKLGVPDHAPLPDHVFDEALSTHRTVLYFHGNAATRAAPNRVQVARHMSKEGHNFIIVDYRGFADSTGTPSEEGLLTDARCAWDYLAVDKGVPADKISIMAQSLGTGVASGLTSRLAAEEIQPHALILVAPFSSISHLLEDYRLGNVIPILSPLKGTPLLKLFLRFLHTRFDTKSVIHTVTCPILILHATDDPVIPHGHSSTLVHHLLDPLLPTEVTDAVEKASSAAEQDRALLLQQQRDQARDSIMKRDRLGQWGVVVRFERGEGLGSITWGEAVRGKHNSIGTDEQSIRLIAETLHAST